MTWRVGRKLGRTLYKGDVCVGMVDTPELASEIVHAMNGTWPCTTCGEAHPKGRSHLQSVCPHMRCAAGTRKCLDCGEYVGP